ncbi:unnamed protein product [Protopolystoma xenopodis]|uniref:Uncharacterized protein n=1 Tax=Protopolystoma xenopodis TaxID=117903 RepID=A0A3S5CKZ6_9PLAT|nr:unnamed protein product [Protopolystoma xenopodis]
MYDSSLRHGRRWYLTLTHHRRRGTCTSSGLCDVIGWHHCPLAPLTLSLRNVQSGSGIQFLVHASSGYAYRAHPPLRS